ncbi:hypothetical protein L7F22_046946 [Adiantum nelumboides]|nr:hypothetical protein [Adiantum nelumboides]
MSSLRRFPSLECAEYALLSPNTRQIPRQLSLPVLSLRKPHGLPPLPPPPRTSLHGNCRHSVPFCAPSCTFKEGASHRRLASSRSLPTWSADYEEDSNLLAVTHTASRKDSLVDAEDSIVYRELCESIHFQIPGRNGCMLSSFSVLDTGRLCEGDEKAVMDLSLLDVRGMPMSLRMLKRARVPSQPAQPTRSKQQQVSGGKRCPSPVADSSGEGLTGSLPFDVPGSVNSAFASLVFMMESLQHQTLSLRRALMSEADARFQMIMERVHQEVQETFVWLFQKVFSCTPKLMLLTMMLLADFATHSIGEHVALAVMPIGEPPTSAFERSVDIGLFQFDLQGAATAADGSRLNGILSRLRNSHGLQDNCEPCFCEGGAGGCVTRVVKVGGGMDGDATVNGSVEQAAMTTQEETQTRLNDAPDVGCAAIFCQSDTGLGCGNIEEQRVLTDLWQQAVLKEVISVPLAHSGHILVAPVRAPSLEADDYVCYDRTDLNYQQELSRDPSNPLLLANYAQFLHVVRHDHTRAEELYKRAVKADPVDGELIGKYASFLWVAKDDVAAADEAYKTALAVDPSNAYHAGSYANFLWNSGADDQDDMSIPSTAYHEVSTS